MADDKKISDLTVATAPTGTELVEIVQGGVNKQTTTQDIANLAGGGGTWGSITGTLSSQTDLQSALDAKAPLASPTFTGTPAAPTAAVGTSTTQIATTAFVAASTVPAATTGTAVAFAVPQIYGTPGSPETGNITLTTTGLIVGVIQKMYHNSGTAPTFGPEFVRISGNYVESTLNIIHFEAYSTSRIEYTVTQEI